MTHSIVVQNSLLQQWVTWLPLSFTCFLINHFTTALLVSLCHSITSSMQSSFNTLFLISATSYSLQSFSYPYLVLTPVSDTLNVWIPSSLCTDSTTFLNCPPPHYSYYACSPIPHNRCPSHTDAFKLLYFCTAPSLCVRAQPTSALTLYTKLTF